MRKLILSIPILLFSVLSFGQDYFGVRSPKATSKNLEIFSSTTGQVDSSIVVSLSGTTIDGYTGLAFNPANKKLYAIVKAGSTYKLVTINPATGKATLIGNLSDKFAGLTFTPSGTCYAITGDGANFPGIIYKINPNTASSMLFLVLAGGGKGEAIAYNSSDNKIYRYAGGHLFQAIDPSSKVVNDYNVLSTTFDNESHSLYYNSSSNNFLFTAGNEIYTYTPPFTVDFETVDPENDGYKGIVLKDVVTSLPNNIEQPFLEISPNPANDVIRIATSAPLQDATIRIFSMDGRVVAKKRAFIETNIAMDISSFAPGIYSVVITNNQVSISRQVVRN